MISVLMVLVDMYAKTAKDTETATLQSDDDVSFTSFTASSFKPACPVCIISIAQSTSMEQHRTQSGRVIGHAHTSTTKPHSSPIASGFATCL